MICRKCGAQLLKSDLFCVRCGTKIAPEKKCKSCGVILRDGVNFCPKCGIELTDDMVEEVIPSPDEPEDEEIPVTKQVETVDLPFDLIEATIIKEASRQVLAEKAEETLNGTAAKKEVPEKIEEESVSLEEEPEEDYDGEYDDGYEDDYEDGYDEYETEEEYESYPEEEKESIWDFISGKLLTILMIIIALVFVIIMAAIFFSNRPKKVTGEEQQVEEQTEESTEQEKQEEIKSSIVRITSNVNVRDYPNKDNSNVLQVAKAGEEYVFLGYGDSSENWIKIRLSDGNEGYIYKDYAQIIDQ